MTRKEFITQVVEGLKTNPKAVLRGHGMKTSILDAIASREDVLAKLANIAFSTVYAPKGTKSLVKQNNFQILAYPNFNTLNGKARQDVDAFAAKLSEDDQESFDSNENCLTILMLPDTEQTDSTADNIAYGKSVSLKFDSAVKKEYKMPNATYLVIMFGESAIRKAEVAKAEAKANVNEVKVERTKSPQKIKAKIVNNTKSKLAQLAKKKRKLESKAMIAGAPLKEFARYGRELGLGPDATPAQINAAQRAFNSRTTAGAGVLKSARIDEIQREINTIRMKNRTLRAQVLTATTPKMRADLNYAVRKNNTRIKALENQMGVYADTSARTMKSHAAYHAEIQDKIARNLEEGNTITEAAQRAISELNIPQQQKSQLAQQIIEEIANGQNIQQAVQVSVAQQIPVQQVVAPQLPIQTPVAPVKSSRKRVAKPFQIDQNARVDVYGDQFADAPLSDEEIESTSMPFLSKTREKLSSVLSFL